MRRFVWVLVLGFVLGAGALVVMLTRGAHESVHPRRGAITEAIYGLGKVKTTHRFDVKIGFISTVRQLYVREGDQVKAGDRLIEFDSGVLFKAPFAGTVTLTTSQKGETSLPQVPIVRLEDLQDRYIEVSIEQQGALRVKPDQKVKISFESIRGQTLEGKVLTLFPREDEFLAHIEVANLPENVLPGMTADVSIEVGQIPDALLIPLSAVRGGYITVKKNGKKQKLHVDIGHVDGLWAEVRGSELTVEDEVLVLKSKE